MGGGVIIKPVLDALNIMSVSGINFLSGCTVIGMSAWSVGKNFIKKENSIDLKISIPLSIGAAVGGLIGKECFNLVASSFSNANRAGGVQAILLITATVATLIYTVNRSKVKSLKVTKWYACAVIGFFLGTLGSFLGIGGGPFNMAVLFLFFSMSTKTAVQNSLFVILISQTAGILKTIISGNIANVPIFVLAGMIMFGIIGSEIGGRFGKRLTEHTNTILLECSMVLVILIASYNLRLLFI